jgi:hypothetical protein
MHNFSPSIDAYTSHKLNRIHEGMERWRIKLYTLLQHPSENVKTCAAVLAAKPVEHQMTFANLHGMVTGSYIPSVVCDLELGAVLKMPRCSWAEPATNVWTHDLQQASVSDAQACPRAQMPKMIEDHPLQDLRLKQLGFLAKLPPRCFSQAEQVPAEQNCRLRPRHTSATSADASTTMRIAARRVRGPFLPLMLSKCNKPLKLIFLLLM